MKLTLLVCLVLGVSVTLSHPLDHDYEYQWNVFKMTQNRKFENENEELMRKKIFEENARMIHLHNMQYAKGLKSYTMKLNKYADWTEEELSSLSASDESIYEGKMNGITYLPPMNIGELPNEVDWRDHNLVGPVRDQGSCGSCYAFSALGAIEGQMARVTGRKPVPLSPQNIVDCAGRTTVYNNNGCHGGFMTNVFRYVKDHGVDTEASYPYEFATEEMQCRYTKESVGARVRDHVMLEENDEDQLRDAVARVGPVSVAIYSRLRSFHLYDHGVYDDLASPVGSVTHAVLVVGYGHEDGKDYWLIRNSWGSGWGDRGYIKILRGVNLLNVALAATYPLVV